MPFVRDAMTREVVFVEPGMPARDAAMTMKKLELGMLPVCEGGHLIGSLTDREMTVRMVAEGRDSSSTPVRDIMETTLVFCTEDQDLDDVTALMERKKVHRVFVVDREGRLEGIVSLGKVARTKSEKAAGRVVKEISRSRSRKPRHRAGSLPSRG